MKRAGRLYPEGTSLESRTTGEKATLIGLEDGGKAFIVRKRDGATAVWSRTATSRRTRSRTRTPQRGLAGWGPISSPSRSYSRTTRRTACGRPEACA
jgi:hypothetical protein